jgi:uncharacterized domain HDIG
MEYVMQILNHSLYKAEIDKIKKYEVSRIYCKHGLEHFLDVARIAYLLNLENKLGYSKELIYITGLLHDIGKHQEYTDGIPHEKASYKIGMQILNDIKLNDCDKALILNAILEHRNIKVKDQNNLSGIIYLADKLSRVCFTCEHQLTCNWDNKKKNSKLKY